MADLAPLSYGRVVGRFLANISDGPDIDTLPEFPPLEGTVTFTAGPPKILVPQGEPDPATVVQLPDHYTASLDAFGYLTWRNQRGVRLIAPNNETNPTGWTWRVDFDLSYEGVRIPMTSFSFEVPEYTPGPDPEDPDTGSTGLVDLTLVSPVPGSLGDAVVRGLSVVTVRIDGNDIIFGLDNGDDLPPVTIPALVAAAENAQAAEESAIEAQGYATAAQDAIDSFDLSIGTVTTGAPGDPASATLTGTPPTYELNLTIPEGEQGDVGPSAPDATGSIKGIVQFGGALAGSTATSQVIPDDYIDTQHIADDAVEAAQIADGAVGTAALADGAVTAAKLAGNTITAAQIADNAIGAGELADNAVDTNAIASQAVTAAKIANTTITNAQVSASAAIALSKLAAGYVQGSKNGTVTTITLWAGTEAQYNTATSSGASEDPTTIYLRGA